MVYCHWKGMVTVLDTQCVLTEEVTASCAMFPGCADGGGGGGGTALLMVLWSLWTESTWEISVLVQQLQYTLSTCISPWNGTNKQAKFKATGPVTCPVVELPNLNPLDEIACLRWTVASPGDLQMVDFFPFCNTDPHDRSPIFMPFGKHWYQSTASILPASKHI